MAMTIGDSGLGTLPLFNDQTTYTCNIDGQTFTDPAVYQQHMLMYHGLNITVKAGDTIIKAPDNPVISQPLGIVAPGVILSPIPDLGTGYYNVIQPTLTPGPLTVANTTYTPSPSGTWNGQGSGTPGGSPGIGSVSGWVWVALLAGILSNQKTRRSRGIRRK